MSLLEKLKLPNCKTIFIPDTEEMMFANGDYSGADAMVVAYDSDCAWLINFFATSKEKLYVYMAREYLQQDITEKDPWYKRFKMYCHLCLTGDHEVLTREGWIRLDQYIEGTEIAVWNKDTWDIHFEVPSKFTKDYVQPEEPLHLIKGDSYYQLTTLDHKFPQTTDTKSPITLKKASELTKSARLPYVGNYVGGKVNYNSNYVRLIVALQADGNIKSELKNGELRIVWHFRLDRKITRLKELLTICNIPFEVKERTTKDGYKDTCINVSGNFERYMKTPGAWLLNLSKENLEVFVSELKYWDGTVRSSNGVRTSVGTSIKEWAVWYQTIIQLTGKGSKIGKKWVDGKEVYDVSINARKFYRLANGIKKIIEHKGTYVYCPTTTTGCFMIRNKDNIMVSGNTNYGGKELKAAQSCGMSIFEARRIRQWYFSLCPEIPEWHKRIESIIYSRKPIQNIFGAEGWYPNLDDPTVLNQAYSWIPQSTIAILVNKGWSNIRKKEGWTYVKKIKSTPNIGSVKLQVHDALLVQYPKSDTDAPLRIKKHMEIELPYPKPLIVPVDLKISSVSYGHCH